MTQQLWFDPSRTVPKPIEPERPQVAFRQDVSMLMPTFLRPSHAWQTIQTFRLIHPDIAIVVGDQSDMPRNEMLASWCQTLPGIAHAQLAFDCGLSTARNTLVRLAQTPYVFFTDDDMVFARETFDLDRLIAPLKDRPGGKYDVCAARIRRVYQPTKSSTGGSCDETYEYNVRFFGDEPGDGGLTFHAKLPDRAEMVGGTPVQRADVVSNVFAARRESLLSVAWDPIFRITYEHHDWAIRARLFGLKTCYATDTWVLHDKTAKTDQDLRYDSLRARFDKPALFRKWGCRFFQVGDGPRLYREPQTDAPVHEARPVTAVDLLAEEPTIDQEAL